jgi:hypothetical protein
MEINSIIPASGRMIDEDGSIINIVDILSHDGNVPPVSDRVFDIEAYAPRTGRVLGEDGKMYNLVDILREVAANGGGITRHDLLSHLDFVQSGHRGFASALSLGALAAQIEELKESLIPKPPTNGIFVLHSVDGVMRWVEIAPPSAGSILVTTEGYELVTTEGFTLITKQEAA